MVRPFCVNSEVLVFLIQKSKNVFFKMLNYSVIFFYFFIFNNKNILFIFLVNMAGYRMALFSNL